MADESQQPLCGWIKLYHASGVDVRLPLPLDSEPVSVDEWKAVLTSVDNALAAGWLKEAPGLEEGETKLVCAFVVKKEKENNDGSLTNTVMLYEENAKYSFLTVYLNSEGDCQAFEKVSGLNLKAMPNYIGGDKIERGKSRQLDAFVVPAPKHFGVAMKPNPRYDPNETDVSKKKPKRIFSRWTDLPAGQPAANGQQPAQQQRAADSLPSNMAEVNACNDVNILLACMEKAHKIVDKKNREIVLNGIRQRGADVMAKDAKSAKSREELGQIEDVARGTEFGLWPQQVGAVDEAIRARLQELGVPPEAEIPF